MNTITYPTISSSVAIDAKLAELPSEERQVVIHINHHACFRTCVSSGACSVCLNSTIYLLPNTVSTPSLLVHAINADLLDNMMILKKEVMNFSLIFSGLPRDATSFDFIEPGDGGWRLLNIKRNKIDVYVLRIKQTDIKLIS